MEQENTTHQVLWCHQVQDDFDPFLYNYTEIFSGLGVFFWSLSPIHYPALQSAPWHWFQGQRTFLRRSGELMTRLCCASGCKTSWTCWSLMMLILSINLDLPKLSHWNKTPKMIFNHVLKFWNLWNQLRKWITDHSWKWCSGLFAAPMISFTGSMVRAFGWQLPLLKRSSYAATTPQILGLQLAYPMPFFVISNYCLLSSLLF